MNSTPHVPLGVLNRLGGIRTQSRTTYSVPHFSISASALPSRCGSHNVPPNCRPPSCHVPILELRGSIPSSEVWDVIPFPTRRHASYKPGRPKMGDRSPFFHRVPNNIICHFLGRRQKEMEKGGPSPQNNMSRCAPKERKEGISPSMMHLRLLFLSGAPPPANSSRRIISDRRRVIPLRRRRRRRSRLLPPVDPLGHPGRHGRTQEQLHRMPHE